MKNKSFILCIIGIGVLLIMGCYVFWRDGGMQPEVDSKNRQTEQGTNAVDDVDTNERRDGCLAFNEAATGNYQIDNRGIVLSVPQVKWEQFEEGTFEEGTLEEKINTTLKRASINWITEGVVKMYTCSEPKVYLNTKNLLSIQQVFGMKDECNNFRFSINNYITMDMNSGEQIYLDDIVDIEKFCDFLLKGEKIFAPSHAFTLEQEEADESIRNHLKNLSREELMEILQYCCREQKDFVCMNSDIYGYSTPNLEERPNFHLENTQLVIELDDEWHVKAIVKYKDLKNILNEDFKRELLSYKKNMTDNYKINSYKFVLLIPQVKYEQFEEDTLEEKINMTLCNESINWLTDEIAAGYNSYLESTTYLNTPNFLSMGMTYHIQNGFNRFYKHNYITMDMNSGEQINLDNIVDMEKFSNFLLKGEKYSASSIPLWNKKKDAEEEIRENLKNMKKQKLLDLLRHSKFYLQNSKLTVELDDEWHVFVDIKYENLNDVLKQDFKQRIAQCSVSEQKEEAKQSDFTKGNNYTNPIDDRICGTMYRDISMKLISLSEENDKAYKFMERDYSEIMMP